MKAEKKLTSLQALALQRAVELNAIATDVFMHCALLEGQGKGVQLADFTRTDSESHKVSQSIRESSRWIEAVLEDGE